MALRERVSTLIRANLNDLLARAEDPEKLARQLVLDMEDQLLQVKTQVAVALADQNLLGRKQAEQQELAAQWRRKAELAVARDQDELARAALECALQHRRLAEDFAAQHADQAAEADSLRSAYTRLDGKLAETRARVELLSAQTRRNRNAQRAGVAPAGLDAGSVQARLARLSSTVAEQTAQTQAVRTLRAVSQSETLDERFDTLERNDEVEALLLELKQGTPGAGLEATQPRLP